jgi:hypothetical protein
MIAKGMWPRPVGNLMISIVFSEKVREPWPILAMLRSDLI